MMMTCHPCDSISPMWWSLSQRCFFIIRRFIFYRLKRNIIASSIPSSLRYKTIYFKVAVCLVTNNSCQKKNKCEKKTHSIQPYQINSSNIFFRKQMRNVQACTEERKENNTLGVFTIQISLFKREKVRYYTIRCFAFFELTVNFWDQIVIPMISSRHYHARSITYQCDVVTYTSSLPISIIRCKHYRINDSRPSTKLQLATTWRSDRC